MDKLGYTFYPKDWWTSATFFKLPPELRYLYLEIISIMYMEDGFWQANRYELHKRFGVDPGDKGWELLQALFVVDGIKWSHPSVNKRLKKAIANRQNGILGGRPKTQKTQLGNPKKPTLERERERENEIELEEAKHIGQGEHFLLVLPQTLYSQKYRVNGESGLFELMEINGSILNFPEHAKKFMRDRNGKHFNDIMHVWNDYNGYVKSLFK